MRFRGFRHLVALIGLVGVAAACAWAADATGKWTWTQPGANGAELMVTMELKQDGEKLTGTITRMDVKSEIMEGKIKENDLSFVVVREFNGNQIKLNYKGKLEGDMIKGNISVNFGGQDRVIDWIAKKAPA